MTAAKRSKPGTIIVTCPDFTKTGFRTVADAQRWIDSIDPMACPHEHTITDTEGGTK